MLDVAAVIGTPFKYGGRGPDEYDCYGIVKHCYRETHGVELPEFKSPEEALRIMAMINVQLSVWTEVEQSVGSVVLFRILDSKGVDMLGHVGFVIGPDHFVHTWKLTGGVCVERLSTWRKRIAGFYRYTGDPR